MKKQLKFASFLMSEVCNFDCVYCHTHRSNREKKLVDIDKLIQVLKKAHPEWVVSMTGGEPFLYPDFVKVCKKLINVGFRIALDTNLSTNPIIKKFSQEISPKSVEYIYSSAHVLERERIFGSLDKYLDNVILLKESGFPVQVSYVMYPPLFERFERDYKFFKKKNILIEPKPFNGIYKGRLYSGAYSEYQKNIILKHNPIAFKKTTFYSKNLNCRTGRDLVRIWPDGTISRCVAVRIPLGTVKKGLKLFKEPRPCEAGWCPCFGWDYVTDKITKDRIQKDMTNTGLTMLDIIKTPRVWRKGAEKIKNKGIKAVLDFLP